MYCGPATKFFKKFNQNLSTMSNLTLVAAQNSVVWFIGALAWPTKMQTNQAFSSLQYIIKREC